MIISNDIGDIIGKGKNHPKIHKVRVMYIMYNRIYTYNLYYV